MPRTFDAARAIVSAGLAERAFPAAVVSVGNSREAEWEEAFGRLTYAQDAPPVDHETLFDLASLTKVIATASLAMTHITTGTLSLDWPVGRVLVEWANGELGGVSIRQLLDHTSGLPAHLRLWESARGREQYARALHALKLERPPGKASVYSDPGFILLGLALERVGEEPLDVQWSRLWGRRQEPLMFRPPAALYDRAAPTEFDPWRQRVLCGEVHDENAAALGGVAGHAGLFGTARAVAEFARLVLTTFREPSVLGSPLLMREFAARSSVPGSSRALAWDTALPTSSSGRRMTDRAIGHTGFTGTSLWIDPARDCYAVLLTNRVHPTRANERLLPLRAAFHDALPYGDW